VASHVGRTRANMAYKHSSKLRPPWARPANVPGVPRLREDLYWKPTGRMHCWPFRIIHPFGLRQPKVRVIRKKQTTHAQRARPSRQPFRHHTHCVYNVAYTRRARDEGRVVDVVVCALSFVINNEKITAARRLSNNAASFPCPSVRRHEA